MVARLQVCLLQHLHALHVDCFVCSGVPAPNRVLPAGLSNVLPFTILLTRPCRLAALTHRRSSWVVCRPPTHQSITQMCSSS